LERSSSISIYPAYVEMPPGASVFIDCETADGGEVEWSSSDTSVASVDADGEITALGAGEAVITARLKNRPSSVASCGLKVMAFDGEEAVPDNVTFWEHKPDSANLEENMPISLNLEDIPADFTVSAARAPASQGKSRRIRIERENVRRKTEKKEYVWEISVYDRCSGVSRQAHDLEIHYLLILNATKRGGDTPAGVYHMTGNHVLNIVLDASKTPGGLERLSGPYYNASGQ
jgi:hypothetical protein